MYKRRRENSSPTRNTEVFVRGEGVRVCYTRELIARDKSELSLPAGVSIVGLHIYGDWVFDIIYTSIILLRASAKCGAILSNEPSKRTRGVVVKWRSKDIV